MSPPPSNRVNIMEVGPRDGLQNESTLVETEAKIQMIEGLVDAGLKRVEVTSFVNPRWIPPLADQAEVGTRLWGMGAYEISLADTIGVASPRQVKDVVRAVSLTVPVARLAMHMHDTRGTALANALCGLELGIRAFDSSVGGLGGCPY